MGQAFLKGLLESGAPWGILCLALSIAVVALWKRSITLADRLYELATKQVEVNTETRSTLQNVERDVDDISRRFKL